MILNIFFVDEVQNVEKFEPLIKSYKKDEIYSIFLMD